MSAIMLDHEESYEEARGGYARVSTFGRLTVVPKIRFAVIIQPNISHTQVTISTACVAKRRASTSLTQTLCLMSGLIYGSRYRARPPNSTSALPRSPCSLFTI